MKHLTPGVHIVEVDTSEWFPVEPDVVIVDETHPEPWGERTRVVGWRKMDGQIELLRQNCDNKPYKYGDTLTEAEFYEAFFGEML